MFVTAIVTFLIGIGYVFAGLSGKRVGDEPRCLKCAFDLSGQRKSGGEGGADGADGRVVCPECGTEAAFRDLPRGRRVLRVPSLVIGVSITVVLVSGFGYLASASGWSFDTVRLRLDRYLVEVSMVGAEDPLWHYRCQQELLRRISGDEITDESWEGVAEEWWEHFTAEPLLRAGTVTNLGDPLAALRSEIEIRELIPTKEIVQRIVPVPALGILEVPERIRSSARLPFRLTHDLHWTAYNALFQRTRQTLGMDLKVSIVLDRIDVYQGGIALEPDTNNTPYEIDLTRGTPSWDNGWANTEGLPVGSLALNAVYTVTVSGWGGVELVSEQRTYSAYTEVIADDEPLAEKVEIEDLFDVTPGRIRFT